VTAPRFIHLRLHSAYSLLEGATPLKALPGLCERHAMPAVAVTDTNNLFGALEFSENAARAGVQPIIGCQLDVGAGGTPQPGERPADPAPIVLLAQNEAGYLNLLSLSSAVFLETSDVKPHVGLDRLADHADGLICLTGGAHGPVGRLVQDGQAGKAEALLRQFTRR
jgi:DNA polymerase-3 subunit alpha